MEYDEHRIYPDGTLVRCWIERNIFDRPINLVGIVIGHRYYPDIDYNEYTIHFKFSIAPDCPYSGTDRQLYFNEKNMEPYIQLDKPTEKVFNDLLANI